MKTKVITILLILLTIGLTTATSIDVYDRDGNGIIDADERISLDVDIENCRLTPNESRVIDSYSTDNTIILNEEFRLAFLNPEPRNNVATVTVTDTPTVPIETPVKTPVETPEPVETPTVTDIQPPADDVSSNMTILFVVGMILIAGLIAYLYNRQQKE